MQTLAPRSAVALAVWMAVATAAPRAQGTPQAPRATTPRATASIADGWTALGAGRSEDALRVANALLADPWASHDAAALRIAVDLARGVNAALEGYERWLQISRHEDPFLLRPIARTALTAFLSDPQPRIWVAAATALAEAGDRDARQRLDRASAAENAPVEVLGALAALGSAPAVNRLADEVAGGGPRDKTPAIDALRDSGAAGAADAIAPGLRDAAPTSRMSAANALATLGATQAVPALRAALQDPDPAVRGVIELALARLGDGSLDTFANSPVSGVRLQVAEALARRDPGGSWDEAVRPLLQDPDVQMRLLAARLLLQYGRDGGLADPVLAAAASDDSPAGRLETGRTLATLARSAGDAGLPGVLAAARRLLRDRQPDVVIEAARSIVRASGTRSAK